MIVERRDLTLTRIAGRGGFGTVHDVMAPWGGRPMRMAFKEPLAGHPEAQRTLAQMARMVAFRDRLSPLDRGALDLVSAWPVAMVEDRGRPVGALMPFLDDFEVTGLNKDGKLDRVLFELKWLPAPEELARRQKIDRKPYTDVVMRLALAAHLARCVATIHRLGMVIGDLSLANAVASASPPRVVLLDCDAFALLSDGSRKQAHSPGFTPPEIANGAQRLQDHQTDVYKLGLCLLRMLIMGRGAILATDPALTASVLPPDGVELLRRCVSPDRALRPSAEELFDYFEDRVLTMAQPPSILSAALSQTTAVRGRDILVHWEQEGARELVITAPGGRKALDSPSRTGSVPLRASQSGPVTIAATNQHGTDMLHIGHLDVYELPAFSVSMTNLPALFIPQIESMQIPTMLTHLPARPMVGTEQHPPPRLELEPVGPLLMALADRIGSPVSQAAALADVGHDLSAKVVGQFGTPEFTGYFDIWADGLDGAARSHLAALTSATEAAAKQALDAELRREGLQP